MKKTFLFIGIAVLASTIAIALNLRDSKFAWHDLLVEFNGLIFDLVIFGIILTVYESISSRKERIKRFEEEIDDYRFWKDEGSMYRLRGLVKRLVELGVKRIDLSHCYLETDGSLTLHKNLQGWRFSAAYMKKCTLIRNNCTDAEFQVVDLTEANLIEVNFTNCDFSSAILINTLFRTCDLTNANLNGAYIANENWIKELHSEGNKGIEKIIEDYEISPVNHDGSSVFRLSHKRPENLFIGLRVHF